MEMFGGVLRELNGKVYLVLYGYSIAEESSRSSWIAEAQSEREGISQVVMCILEA